jgi:hypothetical protein
MRDEFKDPEAAKLFAQWILATVAEMSEGYLEAVEHRLKALGFHAYMHPSHQMPVLESWYNGPIQVGMKFVWRPGTETEEVVRVTKVVTEHHEHDPVIFTDTLRGSSKGNNLLSLPEMVRSKANDCEKLRLFSLLDLMNKFNAWGIGGLLTRLQKHKREIIERRDMEGGDTCLTDEEISGFGCLRDKAYELCAAVRFEQACQRIPIIEQRLYADRTLAGLQNVLDQLGEEILGELHGRSFLWIPEGYTSFVENDALFGREVKIAFPSATVDIKQAGNCLAVDCNTAAVFHLMRVAEHGLRALARKVGVKLTHNKKPCPVEYADWEKVITGIKIKIDLIRKLPIGQSRKEKLERWSDAADHCVFMRDIWRNNVSHTRTPYSAAEAMAAFERVRDFMKFLATGI